VITYDLIDTLFADIASVTGMPFIRADQKGAKFPVMPFGTYKIMLDQGEQAYQESQVRTENGADPTLVDIAYQEKSRATIEINAFVRLPTQVEGLKAKLVAVRDYFRGPRTFPDYVVRLIDPSPQDRTSFQDPDYLYQLGFDIRIDSTIERKKAVEAIGTLEVTPTIDGDVKDKIVVTAP